MEENLIIEPTTLGRIVSIVESMPEDERYILLRKLRLQQAMKLAKAHDEWVRENPRELTDEEIVEMVREVRHELAENDKFNS